VVKELSEKYIQERQHRHVVYEDVVPTLRYLKENYRLGLLTNGAPDLQRTKLDASGLADFFDAVIISGEVGIGKPDPRIFELALDQLGAAAHTTAMIGNSLRSDVAPALELHLMTIWVNREVKHRDDTIIPNAEVSNLTELKDIFQAHRPK
jgi:putative hydrolase of the HAD superfamily